MSDSKFNSKGKKLISVVIPAFNAEEYLEKCLKSVCRQSYNNLEIIIVNDGSTDETEKIAKRFAQEDKRIKYVSHAKNMGLFQARVTGVKKAEGEYIAFVDSDDYVGIDWLRLLVKKAIETQADIVVGNTICEDENHWKYIYNISYFSLISKECLIGEDILKTLIENEGMNFSAHTVWNKLYSRKIWEQGLKHFEKITEHFTMTEDIVFSIVLHFYAKKQAYSNHDGYFYFRNKKSSTVDTGQGEKLKKNIDDLIFSFTYVKNFLQEKGLFSKYEQKYQNWKNRYFRWWSYTLQNGLTQNTKEEEELKKKFLNFFEKEKYEYAQEVDGSFTEAITEWNPKYEELKKKIMEDEIEWVSFDIWDTLIVRPFLEPSDLFVFMQEDFEKLTQNKAVFKDIRMYAEEKCRKIMQIKNPNYKDVTLHEIYQQMSEEFSIPIEDCMSLAQKEEELEIKFSETRQTGKELYELAQCAKKKIILISDMYLQEETMKKILEKNGYCSHIYMFLSSKERCLKYSGELYQVAINTCKITEKNMLHIGDNWNVDYLKAKELGIQAWFLPKCKDILFNTLGDAYTGDSIGFTFDNRNSIIDLSKILKEPTVRCLYALVANEIYDNPFVSFNSLSNYNRNPYFIGYFPVGMHLLGIMKWITKELKKNNYEKIHFIARDGYLPKKMYDLVKNYEKNLPESQYIYASRKALNPIMIRKPEDFYSIKNNHEIFTQTPESIYKLYSSVLLPLDKKMREKYKKEGIRMERKFENENEFKFFLDKLIEFSYDKEKADENFLICRDYFQHHIGKRDVTFDLGYSGRLQESVCEALDYPIDTCYLHTNGVSAMWMAQKNGFQIKSYYDFTTPMSGVVNEFIFSEYGPSCIGYKKEQTGEIAPVFEEKRMLYQEAFLLNEIERGCKNFIKKFYETFLQQMNYFEFRGMDTSLAYEKFLMNSKWFDINLFQNCYLEDEYYGNVSKKKLSDHWWWQINDRKSVIIEKENNHQESKNKVQYLESSGNTETILTDELQNFYQDGMFMALYRKMNEKYPIGSKKRERLKKIAGIFLKKGVKQK